jgi:hypothetical protein
VIQPPELPGAKVAEDFCWGELVARLMHPVQVEIIEALRWIGGPLTAGELEQVLYGELSESRLEHHLQRLARLDALKQVPKYDPAMPISRRAYLLAKRSRKR